MLVNGFKANKALSALKNILPATIVGFSSMSSAAAMPILIEGATKNAEDKELPKRIVPFVTNTNMMGDALAIPLMAMSLYIVEYGHFPSPEKYLIFAMGYVLAKFASAGIPGGTILIMIPVLEAKLGFTSEMSSIILTTYLLFDPFCTLGSIFGNGAFSIGFEKLKKRFIPQEVIQEQQTLKKSNKW
jgi:Na+/H+-dicarboxylate symporter